VLVSIPAFSHTKEVWLQMTVPDLIQRLPHLRDMFPPELMMEWSPAEILRAEQKQHIATWKGLNAWRRSISPDFSPPPMDDFDDPFE
jgi:hypothetical protein